MDRLGGVRLLGQCPLLTQSRHCGPAFEPTNDLSEKREVVDVQIDEH
jgi:hypothetical protein